MRIIALWLSIVCLAANVVPSILYLAGRMDLATMKDAMVVATIAWFAIASYSIYGTKPPQLGEPVIP